MNVKEQIREYILTQSDGKQSDLKLLHNAVLNLKRNCKLWFLEGKNSEGKVISNPNIGYGTQTITYADGKTREFYQVGLSANTSGISVYIMGLSDKKYLANTYGKKLGKASVTGYCIKFKSVKDINVEILMEAIKKGV